MAQAGQGSEGLCLPPPCLAGWSSVGCRVSHTHTPNSSELPEDPIPSLAEMMVGGGSLGAAESHQARGGTEGLPELGIGRRGQIAACAALGP